MGRERESIGEALLGLTAELGLEPTQLAAILAAIDRSHKAIERARDLLGSETQLHTYDLDFIAFGSLARFEMTTSSDLDYLLVGKADDHDTARNDAGHHAVNRLRAGMVDDVIMAEPGKTGLFGTTIDPDEMTQAIGLQADTNHSLSRRLLLLEESVSLFDTDAHHTLLKKILSEYLASRKPGSRIIPRVLLNDIMRYWRTIAVDYHAKSSPERPYSLRYLKLLIPRKLCYISALAPLYLLAIEDGTVDELEFLSQSFSQPPMIRLAHLLVAARSQRHSDSAQVERSGKIIFETLNEFILKSGDSQWRKTIAEECDQGDPRDSDNFGAMRNLGRELHTEIGQLFTTDALIPFTKEYMLT